MLTIYWINGWLFVEDEQSGTGTVYYSNGSPTLAVASTWGSKGSFFSSKQEAIEFYSDSDTMVLCATVDETLAMAIR